MTQNEKLLDKLGKLKRHADSAKKIGNEKEVEAFAEMFQKLVLANKLDVSDLDFEQQERDEPVDRFYIDYTKYGMQLKRKRSDWIQELASVVAEAHFCQILVHPGSTRITLVGRKSDAEVAEYVLITLQRACEQMSKRAYYKYWFELFEICATCDGPKTEHFGECAQCKHPFDLHHRQASGAFRCTSSGCGCEVAQAHPHSDHTFVSSTGKAAGFKASWLNSFIERLAQRYHEERQGHAGESTALVRLNRAEKAVVEWIKENVKKTVEGLQRNARWNREGLRLGKEAANKLDLGTPKAVKTTESRKLS